MANNEKLFSFHLFIYIPFYSPHFVQNTWHIFRAVISALIRGGGGEGVYSYIYVLPDLFLLELTFIRITTNFK